MYSTVEEGNYLNFYIQNNTVGELNPTIIIYTNVWIEIYINSEYQTNVTGKYIFQITSNDQIQIFSNYANYYFASTRVSNDQLNEIQQNYSLDTVLLAFNIGVFETLIAIFLISPLVAYILRRRRL